MSLTWPDLLDALEERTRRAGDLVTAGGRGDPVPTTALTADGPVPPELELRLRVLLARTREVEDAAGRRLRQAKAALHYGG